MNQAIRFPDRGMDEARHVNRFPALVNGMQHLRLNANGAQSVLAVKSRRNGWPLFVDIAGIWKMKPRISFSTSEDAQGWIWFS